MKKTIFRNSLFHQASLNANRHVGSAPQPKRRSFLLLSGARNNKPNWENWLNVQLEGLLWITEIPESRLEEVNLPQKLKNNCRHSDAQTFSRNSLRKKKVQEFSFCLIKTLFFFYSRNIWNNLLQPQDRRVTNVQTRIPIMCPSEKVPYFFTKFNSV